MSTDIKYYTLDDVKKHKKSKDCWIVIDGNVLDVTKFLELHPGGREIISDGGGTDMTDEFDKVCHSNAAYIAALKYSIGKLKPSEPKK